MLDPSFDPNSEASYDGIFGLPCTPEEARVVLVPVPFDASTSYQAGTAQGPATIYEASMQVDLHDAETGEPWKHGIAMLPIPEHITLLNEKTHALTDKLHEDSSLATPEMLSQINQAGEQVMRWVREQTERWLEDDKLVGIIGGEHSVPLGGMLAIAERHPGLGILHIDAHADLRVAYQGMRYSHASIMHNALELSPNIKKLVQVAVRDLCEAEAQSIAKSVGRISTWYDSDMARAQFEGTRFSALVGSIIEELPSEVYVSFDIDGLDPALCPNTGTPVPGGLSFAQASYLLGALARSGRRVVGFDLCEVAPSAQGDRTDAIVGARVLYKLIGWALRTLPSHAR